jgi:hypothetical protein
MRTDRTLSKGIDLEVLVSFSGVHDRVDGVILREHGPNAFGAEFAVVSEE